MVLLGDEKGVNIQRHVMVGLGEGSEPTDIIGNHLNTLALTRL